MMGYLIPIVIAAVACSLPFILTKWSPEPATWRWWRIFWIVMPLCVAWTFIVPALGWPQQWMLPAIAASWYIVGRASQQNSYREYRLKQRMEQAR